MIRAGAVITPSQAAVIHWLAQGKCGASSETIAFWLAFRIRRRHHSHPYDVADLDRCLQLLSEVPDLRADFARMSELSPEWSRLVEAWPALELAHSEEIGLDWVCGSTAPRTLLLMRTALDAATEDAT